MKLHRKGLIEIQQKRIKMATLLLYIMFNW